jgi:UDP-sulfoquinovose synthase
LSRVSMDAAESATVKILVLGGDGFCGWPTALYLSARSHEVVVVDNLSRRNIDNELETSSLTPIRPIGERVRVWAELTGKPIGFYNINVAEQYHRLLTLIAEFEPEAIVHFAEQRAAPYSMKSSYHKRYTVNNNLNATNNLLAAVVESGVDSHVVHLGTMGVYGYGAAGIAIPEGYLPIKVENGDQIIHREILYPADPGSVYHLTKTQDQLLFAFYNKNDKVRITDLHQGIVWGTQTEETLRDERLINRFDYDGDYGTVLNRFIVQAVIGYPLTVHGSGRQTRAFINIRDSVRCVELAILNPPKTGERVRIFNQMTEAFALIDLAQMIATLTGAKIAHLPNPRKEPEANGLHAENRSLIELGLRPIKLDHGLLREISEVPKRYAANCDRSKIPCTAKW